MAVRALWDVHGASVVDVFGLWDDEGAWLIGAGEGERGFCVRVALLERCGMRIVRFEG
jgi:hypothetical protein